MGRAHGSPDRERGSSEVAARPDSPKIRGAHRGSGSARNTRGVIAGIRSSGPQHPEGGGARGSSLRRSDGRRARSAGEPVAEAPAQC